MPNIELTHRVGIASSAVMACLAQTLADIAKKKEPYDDFSLKIDLGSLHIPNVATVMVPVTLHVGKHIGVPPSQTEIAIEARDNTAYFPQFTGIIRADAAGASATVLHLSGTYDVPGGMLGSTLDRTVLAGAASASLSTFLQWLCETVEERIKHNEYETARQMLHRHD